MAEMRKGRTVTDRQKVAASRANRNAFKEKLESNAEV